jgi:hypothetical protein
MQYSFLVKFLINRARIEISLLSQVDVKYLPQYMIPNNKILGTFTLKEKNEVLTHEIREGKGKKLVIKE